MIRLLKPNDLDSVMKIWLETNIKSHPFIDEIYWKKNYDFVKDILPSSTVFVFEENGTIKGFIGLSENYIAGIFVDEKNQSNGIGKILLDYTKEQYSELSLHVYEKNHRAVLFYLRENFTTLKSQIDTDTNEKELVMCCISNH